MTVWLVPSCGGDDSAATARAQRREEVGAKLKVAGIPDDGRLVGNTVEIKLSGAGVEIVEPDGDTSGKTGHYVVFVDRDPVALGAKIPGERDAVESSEAKVMLTGFTTGAHALSVVLADGAHRRIGTHAAEADFTVTGPTIRASAPEKSPAKQPVVVSVAVENVGIVAADGSTAADTGHLDVFVDREPTALGTPVPAERGIVHTAGQTIAVPDLKGGEHELWVVLVHGDEKPFDPKVADKVVVEIG
ncbi:MAG TPA: DUF4399 domain-containing protein [Acidimicrobiales bacterium]|nr:DUF4399 domain-containing protein [Acidimicrobiales bacterium]